MDNHSPSPEEFVRYFDGVRKRTMRLFPLVRDEDLEWRPEAGAFSFGDVFRHLAAAERWMWAENAAGRPSRYPGHEAHLVSGREAIHAYVETLHAQAMEIFTALTPEALLAPVNTPAGAALPTWKWLRAMVEHEAHHRGQLYLMLRMRGVATPPIFGLTSEQVKAASVSARSA